MPTPGKVYSGNSSNYGYRLATYHRYLISYEQIGSAKYLALDGPSKGSVRTIKASSWRGWAKKPVSTSKWQHVWEGMIASQASEVTVKPDEPTTLGVSVRGNHPTIVMGSDIKPGMTVIYGKERYLAINFDNEMYLVDLSDYAAVTAIVTQPYIVAKAQLTLSV